ncbi:MAG: type II secretion system protein [Nitrospirota bacterium]
MPTFKTGIWTSSNRNQLGFTLIELIVVITILGVVTALVLPRIDAFKAGQMKRASRHLGIFIQEMTLDSASKKESYRLHFNLGTNEYWKTIRIQKIRETDNKIFIEEVRVTAKNERLPEGLVFVDIITPQHGKVTEGEVFSEFYPIGIEPVIIHLKEKEARWTLIANPLTGRVKIFDHYLDEH